MRKRSIVASIEASIRGTGIAVRLRELDDVVAVIAVLRHGLTAPERIDRGAKSFELRAGVVVVVLARHLVPSEREQACDAVAIRAVAGGGDDDRAGRVRRHHLDLDSLPLRRPAAAVLVVDLGERVEEEPVRQT